MQSFARGKGSAISSTMPKPNCSFPLKNIVSRKLGRVMKLTGIIILAACLHVSAKGVTQTVTLSEHEASFQKILQSIEKQTNYAFFYKEGYLNEAKKVTINVENKPLREVLDLCFKDQPFTYTISGKNIAIKLKEKEKAKVMLEGIDISGKITDSDGVPLSGANVKVRGSNKGAVTNADGSFVLNDVDENAELEISYVGFETVTLALKGKRSVSVTLRQRNSILDETIVIAYGTTTKRLNTGNISSVKSQDIANQPINNPLLALQGRVPGLFVSQTSGLSGAAVKVAIQGQNSIALGNDPLYVIDGIPYPSILPSTGLDEILGNGSGGAFVSRGSPLTYVNPADIESIEILKDADATSIYGSRAANGAVLITTKKGVNGRFRVNVNLKHGWAKAISKLKLLNSRQYLDMRYQAFNNDKATPSLNGFPPDYDLLVWDTTRYTDWQKTLIGNTAKYNDVNVNVSGGTPDIKYLIGATYHKETTVFPGDLSDKKVSTHFSLSSNSVNQKIKFDLSGSFLTDNNRLPGTDLTSYANVLEPVAPPLYNSDGSLNWAQTTAGTSTWNNPLATILYNSYKNQTDNLISSAAVSYSPFLGLEVKSTFGFTKTWTKDYTASPIISMKPETRFNATRSAGYGDRTITTWTMEPQISYKKSINRSTFEGLVGSSFQENDSKSQYLYGRGYNSDEVLSDIKSAASIIVPQTSTSLYKYNAIFARLNYNWKNEYVINLNVRRDGSSRFGSQNKFHNFWSAGAAWIFSEENFVKNTLSFLSFGKLRGSYGTTGNDLITDYAFLGLYDVTYSNLPYQNTTGLYQRTLSNPYIQWEETQKIQTGIDLGFFNDRVLLNVTYARNRSSNQLLRYALPMITGFQDVTGNFPATVQNINWEFSMNTVAFRGKNFSWTSTLNFTLPKNKLASFPNLSTSTYANSLVIGQPVNITKVYRFEGVDPQTGWYQYSDSAGNITSAPGQKDRTILINTLPKFYGGFQNSIRYKQFEFDFLLQFVKQVGPQTRYTSNAIIAPGVFLSGLSNQPVTVLENSWKKPGDNSAIQRYTASFFSGFTTITGIAGSDAAYSDASYIRLKNVSISWQAPDRLRKKMGTQNTSVFIQAQNLFTLSRYKGVDPETQSVNSLPPLRVLVVGLQVGL